MIRSLVFDFDGTLVRSNEIKRRAFFEAAQSQGADAEIVATVLDSGEAGDRYQVLATVARRLEADGHFPSGVSVEDVARLMEQEYSRICEMEITVCNEVGGAGQTLRQLCRAGYSMFVSSATPTHYLRRLVERRSLAPYFVEVLGAESDKTANLRRVLERTELPAEGILCVGDGEDDRLAAAALGCHFAGVDESSKSGVTRFGEPPAFVVDRLSDLFAVIDRIDGREAGHQGRRGQ